MKPKLLTQPIRTGNITLSSNLTSITVNGARISRVEEIVGQEKENPSTIYLDLMVSEPTKQSDILEATEEVDLVLNLEDAVELGLRMVALGMEHKTDDEVSEVMARLSQLIAEYR